MVKENLQFSLSDRFSPQAKLYQLHPKETCQTETEKKTDLYY